MTLVEWVGQGASRVAARYKLALALGLTEMAVRHWCNGQRRVPAERCRQIEVATRGAVTCEELRPDVFAKTVGRPRKLRKKAA